MSHAKNEDTIALFDPATVAGLTMTVDFMGASFTACFAAPLDGRDPMEMTLGEWMAWPQLSADFMLSRVLEDHRS